MDSAKSSTVFPIWAIGLIIGAGVLLFLVAATIIIGRCVMEKKNKGKNDNLGPIIPVIPPELSESDPGSTTYVKKIPFFQRFGIIVTTSSTSFIVSILYEMRSRASLGTSEEICNLSNFSHLIERCDDLISVDIKVYDENFYKKDDNIQEEIKGAIACELNVFKNFIKKYKNEGNKNVINELLECANKINGLEPKVTNTFKP